MTEKKPPKWAVIDIVEGDYNEFHTLDVAEDYARNLVSKKSGDYDVNTVLVCGEWSSDDLLPGE